MDLLPCAQCGSPAEIYLWPSDKRDVKEYVVDCTNKECPGSRATFTEAKYESREAAVAGWNAEQEEEE